MKFTIFNYNLMALGLSTLLCVYQFAFVWVIFLFQVTTQYSLNKALFLFSFPPSVRYCSTFCLYKLTSQVPHKRGDIRPFVSGLFYLTKCLQGLFSLCCNTWQTSRTRCVSCQFTSVEFEAILSTLSKYTWVYSTFYLWFLCFWICGLLSWQELLWSQVLKNVFRSLILVK